MDVTEDLESLIRRYVLLGKKSPQGYEVVKCSECNDYQERGGFKFELGTVIYSCFNCSTKAVHGADSTRISKKMRDLLIGFGVPEDELKRSIASAFFKPKDTSKTTVSETKKVSGFPVNEVKLPTGSVNIRTNDSPWCEVAREYLAGRGIVPTDYNFYVTDETSYTGRLLIPYYFRDKIIYWQGRALDESITPRYKNPVVEKDNVFFNMDELYRYTNEPLFVVEGATDAISIGKNAVGMLGSTLTDFRIQELTKVAKRRQVIFVLDKDYNGYKLGNAILAQNLDWYVTCFPAEFDDANDVLNKLGSIWLLNHLATSAVKGFAGQLLIKMNCPDKLQKH